MESPNIPFWQEDFPAQQSAPTPPSNILMMPSIPEGNTSDYETSGTEDGQLAQVVHQGREERQRIVTAIKDAFGNVEIHQHNNPLQARQPVINLHDQQGSYDLVVLQLIQDSGIEQHMQMVKQAFPNVVVLAASQNFIDVGHPLRNTFPNIWHTGGQDLVGSLRLAYNTASAGLPRPESPSRIDTIR